MVQSNFSTVVQQNYSPQIRAGFPGMVSHETSWDASTWLCGTSAGIPFGVVVSASSGNPKQAVIGGTLPIGITVVDITQDRMPLNPVSGTEVGGDIYPQYGNMAVLTRGRIWVMAQADVAANDPVSTKALAERFRIRLLVRRVLARLFIPSNRMRAIPLP